MSWFPSSFCLPYFTHFSDYPSVFHLCLQVSLCVCSPSWLSETAVFVPGVPCSCFSSGAPSVLASLFVLAFSGIVWPAGLRVLVLTHTDLLLLSLCIGTKNIQTTAF